MSEIKGKEYCSEGKRRGNWSMAESELGARRSAAAPAQLSFVSLDITTR